MGAAIRPATRGDVPAVAEVLARAFAADPAMVWAFPDAARRGRALRRLYAAIVRWEGIPLGATDVALDETSRPVGAAVWRPPGVRGPRGYDVRFALAAARVLDRHATRLVELGMAVRRVHPREPHAYLQLLGVEPDRQRTGIGRALLATGLARCDAAGSPVHLETVEADVGYYERFGFRVTARFRSGRSGPLQYAMWRDARAPAPAATAR